MKIEYVIFDETFLKKSYVWLQDEELCNLINAKPVSLAEQKKWFINLPQKKDYYIKGVICDGIPIGAVGIKHIRNGEGEYWGYIGEKRYWGNGIGKKMVSEMIKDSKIRFNISELYLEVLECNVRALGLYKSMGFEICSEESGIIRMHKFINE